MMVDMFISPAICEAEMRTITINGQTVYQEIQSYDHNVGNYVRVLIGTGKQVDGKFEFDVPQQFQTCFIADKPERVAVMTGQVLDPAITDYSDLMAMGGITLENLWSIIDQINARS